MHCALSSRRRVCGSTCSWSRNCRRCSATRRVVREVLLNLISNAWRFTDHGGVTVRAGRHNACLRISIADTGPGIPAEGATRLFQPFQQLDGSIRRRYGGTGLGLAISKRLVELHGGRIWVESQEAAGATFVFELPLDPPSEGVPSYQRGLRPGWEYLERTHPSAAPKTRLRAQLVLVDKGDTLRRILARRLEGVDLVTAPSLAAAVEGLHRAPAQALVINETLISAGLEQLQTTVLPPGTPVVLCSLPGVDVDSEKIGHTLRLVKPVSRETLLGALERAGVAAGNILIVDDEPDALAAFRAHAGLDRAGLSGMAGA